MTAKEYLSQAYRLDLRINSKIEQIASLNELATKCTSVISDMPRNPNCKISTMADTIDKIVDLKQEINNDLDRLVGLKKEIVSTIRKVDNHEYQTLLEKRYLCFFHWEQIAVAMGYSIDNIFKLHKKALDKIQIPKTLQ